MLDDAWEIYALKYAERSNRKRSDSFIFDDDHASPHPMDYFLWVLRRDGAVIVVDTGYDAEEGAKRDRPILREPVLLLRDFGVDPDKVEIVIVTHLHYDHAGTLDRFPNAMFHLQAAEMAYATGPCMCHGAMRMPFTADHVCAMIRKVYSGKVVFHEGDAQIAEGVEVYALGGHSRGLQCVRVKTRNGWVVLASDGSHYYENFLSGKLFPIVENPHAMLLGFLRLRELAGDWRLVVPGHDPLVREFFPAEHRSKDGTAIHRLDAGPGPSIENLSGLLP